MRATSWTAALLALVVLSGSALAQEDEAPRRPGPRGGGLFEQLRGAFPGGFDGGAALLRLEQVQKELELVDEQKEKLRKIVEDSAVEMRELFSGLQDVPADERAERFAELRTKMQELAEKTRKEVEEVLLPNQRDRLKQLSLQMRMRGGTAAALASEELADALKLTDEQRAKLRQTERELADDLRQKTEELRKEAREKLLGILTPEQRQTLESMVGEAFELQPQTSEGQPRFLFRGRRPGQQE